MTAGAGGVIESMDRTRQTVHAVCYGGCGGCVPSGAHGGNIMSSNRDDRIMAIAYDMALGT